jgi:hypothetical protein
MDSEVKEMIHDIDRLLELSDYYFHDSDYEYHRKQMKKLKKKLKHNKIQDCTMEGCELT